MAYVPADADEDTPYTYQTLDDENQSENLAAVNDTDPDLLAATVQEEVPYDENEVVSLSSYREEGDEVMGDEIANLVHPGVDEGTDE